MNELPPPDGLDDTLAGGRPPSLDDFRGVLARHRRTHLQRLTAGLAAAVVIAAGVGYVVGNNGHTSGTTQLSQNGTAAAPASTPSASSTAGAVSLGGENGGGSFTPGGGAPTLTQILVRNADDGVRVRLYQQAIDKGGPAGACVPTGFLQTEVSDDQVAGIGGGMEWTTPTTAPLDPIAADVVGAFEPQPILTVVSHTGAAVAKVTLTTAAGATDHAAPTAGWVALAVQLPASADSSVPDGTLTATAADGTVLATDQLSSISGGKNPPCVPAAQCFAQQAAAGDGSGASGAVTGTSGADAKAAAAKAAAAACGCLALTPGASDPSGSSGAAGTSGSVCNCQVVPPAANGPSGTTGVSLTCSASSTGSVIVTAGGGSASGGSSSISNP